MRIRQQEVGNYLPDEQTMLEWNRFFDCYVTKIVGKSDINRYLSKNHDKLLLDKITTSDIAYAILVYENSLDVWLE